MIWSALGLFTKPLWCCVVASIVVRTDSLSTMTIRNILASSARTSAGTRGLSRASAAGRLRPRPVFHATAPAPLVLASTKRDRQLSPPTYQLRLMWHSQSAPWDHGASARSFATTASRAEPEESPDEENTSGVSVKILPNGVRQLKKLLAKEPDRFLRLTVNSGGCSGYQYEFKMDTQRKEGDV